MEDFILTANTAAKKLDLMTYKIAVSSYSKSTSKSKSAKEDYSKKIKSLFF